MSPQHQGLTELEIEKVVYRYIGVNGGYLGDFTSYRSHYEFYLDLDLTINPNQYEGTTRQCFMAILAKSPPHVQAIILDGILKRFPVKSDKLRTQERFDEIRRLITRLQSSDSVSSPQPEITTAVVTRALADTETLIASTGATSGVDRVHTALHGYLHAVCQESGITVAPEATLTELFKQIRNQHPAFQQAGPRDEDILKIIRAHATILDALNPVRNKASVAHPNEILLQAPEAMLVINTARTILQYLNDKLAHYKNALR